MQPKSWRNQIMYISAVNLGSNKEEKSEYKIYTQICVLLGQHGKRWNTMTVCDAYSYSDS
jgi:hypothetical protein